MKKKQCFEVLVLLLVPLGALAGQQVCGKTQVAANLRTCPDGSIPMYVADEIKPYAPPQPVARPIRPNDAATPVRPTPVHDHASGGRRQADSRGNLNYYFGVWRTNIPGAVWTSPSGYQGRDWLHVSAGAAAGDLIIKPDGTFLWNSYGGKRGRWIAGDADYPIVLIDTSENRRWKVGADPKHTGGRDIMVWDGNSFYYNGRK